MSDVRQLLNEASAALEAAGIAEAQLEARSLLGFAIGADRTYLLTNPHTDVSADKESRFRDFLARRCAREPFQHITGVQEFYGLDFRVTPDVLIPRPETEVLVEAAVGFLKGKETPTFAEVGVGSGCISVSILHSVPSASAIGLEISEAAMEIASENAMRHGVLSRLELRLSDVFSALTVEKFDLIASNPPYIPLKEFAGLQPEVRNFDPRQALTDEGDGLSVIRKIIEHSPHFLKKGGALLIEIGFGQGDEVKAMFKPDVWSSVVLLEDLQSIPRTVVAQLRAE